MPDFAERVGARPARKILQTTSLDDETRTLLWNITSRAVDFLSERDLSSRSKTFADISSAVWAWGLKLPADELRSSDHAWRTVKSVILQGEWYDGLEIIEKIVKYIDRFDDSDRMAKILTGQYDSIFEECWVAYRFIGLELVAVDTHDQAEAIERALSDTQAFVGARHHLSRCVALMSDRTHPDYANAVKEAISSVESICREVTGETTLGKSLSKLEGTGMKIHPALRESWSKMYGWTSDASGIRHASISAPDVDPALAKYMAVASSAFVSYLIEAGRKSGLLT